MRTKLQRWHFHLCWCLSALVLASGSTVLAVKTVGVRRNVVQSRWFARKSKPFLTTLPTSTKSRAPRRTRAATTTSTTRVASTTGPFLQWRKGHIHSGIVLWSYGRSATTYFTDALVHGMKTQYCTKHKEALNPTYGDQDWKDETKSLPIILQECVKEDLLLLHVKPQHLLRVDYVDMVVGADGHTRFFEQTDLSSKANKLFFDASLSAGFKVVIAHTRPNILAGWVSKTERKCVKDWHRGQECAMNFSAKIYCGLSPECGFGNASDNLLHNWEQGVDYAQSIGLQVVRTTFTQITDDLCGTVLRLNSKFCASVDDRKRNGGTSSHELSITDRIGKRAYSCIVDSISRCPDPEKYRWMLNLSREEPPAAYREFFGL